MKRFNDGLIFTKENCVGCNKCLSSCPVLGANVSVSGNDINTVKVSAKRCIHCGNCLRTCTKAARAYSDDTDVFFSALSAGKKISLIVSPLFGAAFGDKAGRILFYLKKHGIRRIYNSAYGAEISLWAHVNYLLAPKVSEEEERAYIANICPVLANYAGQCAPELLDYIIPVQSPVMSTAVYARKYLGDKSEFAYLGPCISKKDEFSDGDSSVSVSYNLTFSRLMSKLRDVELPGGTAAPELETNGLGEMISVSGGMRDCVSLFVPDDEFLVSSAGFTYEALSTIKKSASSKNSSVRPLMIDFSACIYGCAGGSGFSCSEASSGLIFCRTGKEFRRKFSENRFGSDHKENLARLNRIFSGLRPDDFRRTFGNRYLQPPVIPDNVYDDIFTRMHKTTFQKRTIDCGSCGYKTCRRMVEAVALGYSKMENCVNFMHDEMEKLYFTDVQTGLPNRIDFERRTAKFVEKAADRKYALAVGDINRLGVINDLYGFETGNRVLRFVGRWCSEFSGQDGYAARFGGGTFAMFFPYTEDKIAELHKCAMFDLSEFGIDFPVTVRFGLCPFGTSDNYTAKDLRRDLNFASFAMGKITDHTHNTWCVYTDEMRRNIAREMQITSVMHKALENGEFVLYFQPQFNYVSNSMVGAETLVRWKTPSGEIISPGIFIPIFEKNGFIKDLDRYIWKKAFEMMRSWLDSGRHPVPISVNISRISTKDCGIVDVIKNLRSRYGIPDNLIHFEITESAYMDDSSQLIRILNQIRSLGYEIAMDDFGSGYSSLNTLKDIPIDILKLDMGFLRGENGSGSRGGNIISSVVRMAQDLGLKTVAEGVEETEQADFLKSVGCDIIQGYLYSKPVPPEKFLAMMDGSSHSDFVAPRPMSGILNVNNFFNPSSGETRMFENFTGAAAVIDCSQGIMQEVRINSKFLDLLELDSSPTGGLMPEFFRCIDTADALNFRRTVDLAIRDGNEQICVLCYRGRKDGIPIWIKSHIWKIATNGVRNTLYILADDITAEKNSGDTVRSVSRKIDLILDSAPIAITVFSVAENENKAENDAAFGGFDIRTVRTNNAFLEQMGYTLDEVLSWNSEKAAALIHPDDMAHFLDRLRALVGEKSGGSQVSCVCRMKTGSGEYRRLNIVAAGVREEDGRFWAIANFYGNGVVDGL